MINVSKKELKERAYTPYEITITISSQDDHNRLANEIRELKNSLRNSERWYDYGRKFEDLRALLEQIESHKL